MVINLSRLSFWADKIINLFRSDSDLISAGQNLSKHQFMMGGKTALTDPTEVCQGNSREKEAEEEEGGRIGRATAAKTTTQRPVTTFMKKKDKEAKKDTHR